MPRSDLVSGWYEIFKLQKGDPYNASKVSVGYEDKNGRNEDFEVCRILWRKWSIYLFLRRKRFTCRVGYCAKDVSEMIWAARNGKQWAINKLNGLDKNGKPSEYRKQYIKWNKLCWDSDILISPYCCIEQKEKPVRRYERETGRHPILGLLAQESARRTEAWIRTGCNSFDGNRPVSKPISFFTEQDVLRYIWYRGLVVAPPYGEICPCGSCCGQTYLFPADEMDIDHTRLCCTGEKRTGCIFCLVGAHLDRGAKIKRLKQYNKRLYEYCMEELGMEKVLKWILRNY